MQKIHTASVSTSDTVAVDPAARLREHAAWKAVAVLVTGVALAWVLWMFVDVWPELMAKRQEIRLGQLAIGLVLAVFSSYLIFIAFVEIVRSSAATGLNLRELGHLYFTAQLLKHLPGRIWGIGYQWAAGGRTHSLGVWLSANIAHMMLATYFVLSSAILVILIERRRELAPIVAIVVIAGYAGLWRGLVLVRWMARRIGKFKRVIDLVELLALTPGSVRARLFFLFVVGWSLYYAAWYFNGAAYTSLGGHAGVQMCALYLLAWFAGYVSLLTPSGLGIRELVFAWLAKDFPPDAIALMAVVGRVSLLGVDILLGLAFAPFVPKKPVAS